MKSIYGDHITTKGNGSWLRYYKKINMKSIIERLYFILFLFLEELNAQPFFTFQIMYIITFSYFDSP